MKSHVSIIFFISLMLISSNLLSAPSCVSISGEVGEETVCCAPLVALNGSCQVRPTCMGAGIAPASPLNCCVGLILENGLCHDPSPVDPTLVDCNSNPAICIGGDGCFSKRVEDMFSAAPRNDLELQATEAMVSNLESQTETAPRGLGEFCIKNTHCQSYSCSNLTCTTTKICRKADEAENAGLADCEESLTKNSATNICENLPSAVVVNPAVYISDPNPTVSPDGGQCQFVFADDVRQKAEIAIRSVRALEWLLNSIDDGNDCLNQQKYIKDLGDKFLARRKELLQMFNTGMSKIDTDMKVLLAAKEGIAEMVKTIDGDMMSTKDLATRRTSGYDMLRAMYDRNLVFQVYESEMNKLTDLTMQRVIALTERLNSGEDGWGSHSDKKWSMPIENGMNDTIISFGKKTFEGKDSSCRGGGLLNIGRRRVYKRWERRHVYNSKQLAVTGVNEDLARIVYPDRDIASAQSSLNAFSNLPNGKILYMIDALNSSRDLSSVKASVLDYFKKLKSDPTLSSFNYEPELLPLEAKDCIENPAGPSCDKFTSFVDRVAQTGLAQHYAYSTHTRSVYKYYFNKNVWRKKLLEHWKVQLANLTDYYKAMSLYRDDQNACIQLLIDNVKEKFLDNTSIGLNEGDRNIYSGADYVNPAARRVQITDLDPNKKPSDEFQAGLLKSVSGPNSLAINSDLLASRVKSIQALSKNPNAIFSKSNSPSPLSNSSSLNSSGPIKNSDSTAKAEDDKTPEASKVSVASPKTIVTPKTHHSSGSAMDAFPELPATNSGSLSTSKDVSSANNVMSEHEREVVMQNIERTKSQYQPKESDSIFDIIGKTYVRNLGKVLRKKPASLE